MKKPTLVERFRTALKPKRRWFYKSAITGRFVSKAFAEANPATTFRVPR